MNNTLKAIATPLASLVFLLFVIAMFALVSIGPAVAQPLDGTYRTLPMPLPDHPGNVFLAGEQVVVPLPGDWTGAWRVLDYDGKQIAAGQGPGKISLGKLPVGYYEIPRADGKPTIGIGVLAPLAVPTPKTSPIGVDSAVPWSLGNKLPEAANLCALAGINWARARLNWTQMEPKPGQFAPPNNYDAAARELHKAGIQVLQVNHATPPWAGPKSNRFPADLRYAYRFYREMARRWQGQVQAFEPWNEADWPQFGGHTGAEMATLQKACYWGLKAGNPDMIVCQNVFANYFPEVIADFHDNQAWPYFDTLNFHHQKWFQVSLNLGPQERPAAGENALLLPVKIREGEASLSVRLAEEKGGSYSLSYGMGERAKSDDGAISLDAAVTAWTMAEPQRVLDPWQLRSVQISGEAKSQKLKFVNGKFGWATFR